MKKLIKPLSLFVLAAILCLSLASCASGGKASIVFDKKYVYTYDGSSQGEAFYVFKSDRTGYYEMHVTTTSSYSENTYVYSGRIDFVWRVGDDASVYLFETDFTYDENDNTKALSLGTFPLTFGDEFLTRYSASGTISNYILEGSELEKAITKD